jgi:hypothetical protein
VNSCLWIRATRDNPVHTFFLFLSGQIPDQLAQEVLKRLWQPPEEDPSIEHTRHADRGLVSG